MAGKPIIRSRLIAHGGPVSTAIRAAREPDAPWFVQVRTGEPIIEGFHIGRRRDWPDAGRQEVVWLQCEHEGGQTWLGVWRCGAGKPEDPAEWDFSRRVAGIRSMPAEPLDLQAVALH